MDDLGVLILGSLAISATILIGSILGIVAWQNGRRLRTRLDELEQAFITINRQNLDDFAKLRERMDDLQAGTTEASDIAGDAERRETTPEPPSETVTPTEPAEPTEPTKEAKPSDDAVEPSGREPEAGPEDAPEDIAARVAAETAPSGPELAAPGPPPARKPSIEESLGSRWAVWVGGLALALGGIFLARYTIEAGLLGPGARIILGLLFGALLLAAGEYLRRRPDIAPKTGYAAAHIPAILTAAGIIAAFAAIYAAYALYGFIGPAIAFVALGALAVAAILAALLHGVILASVGIIASYATPFLVSTQDPQPLPLAIYVLIVTGTAYAVSRIQLWRWLALIAAAGTFIWGLMLALVTSSGEAIILAVYALAAIAMAVYIFVWSLYPRNPQAAPGRDWYALGAVTVNLLLVLVCLQVGRHDAVSVFALFAVLALGLATASEWTAAALLAISTLFMALLAYAGWQVNIPADVLTGRFGTMPDLQRALRSPPVESFLGIGLAMAALLGGGGFYAVLRSTGRGPIAVLAAFAPVGLLAIAYLRISLLDVNVTLGAAAIALAFVLTLATEALNKRLDPVSTGAQAALAAFAIAAIAALALGFTVLLDRGWLTIALALLCPAIAWVAGRRPVPALPWVAVAVAAAVCLRFLYDPRVVGSDLGTTPVFNWLLYGYGVPTLAFAATAWILGRRASGLPVRIFEALAIIFGVFTGYLLIHHAMNIGRIFRPISGLDEQAWITMLTLAVAIGLQRLHGTVKSPVFAWATMILGGLGFFMIAAAHLMLRNPFFTNEYLGEGWLFNTLFVAYFLPALVAGALAYLSYQRKPQWYSRIAAGLAAALAFAWVSLQVRRHFHGPRIGEHRGFTDPELYTYSAAWIVVGLALLLAGIFLHSRMVRAASGLVIVLAVAKVFLVDMANLTGALRAFSFIGLGIVLIGIGLFYQRLLARPASPATAPERPDEGAGTANPDEGSEKADPRPD